MKNTVRARFISQVFGSLDADLYVWSLGPLSSPPEAAGGTTHSLFLSDPPTSCASQHTAVPAGAFLVAERGSCPLSDKVVNAFISGASGLVVLDNVYEYSISISGVCFVIYCDDVFIFSNDAARR